ncbi:hypothetical protein HJFPF1_01721 [Paramyrothecium foliicola]|nr:hypothetical protein HJFPF1_01721 [Paramyrothecium foliicola]
MHDNNIRISSPASRPGTRSVAMEADTASRYRSRILREMNANRENPFNSPPSSTGSHGTVSPTLSSVFSDPDGESTRRLNEDIARITAPRALPVNWEAAHRKWPEFFGMPKASNKPIFGDHNNARPMSAESKENKPPAPAVKFNDDTTQDTWLGSNRTRAEMQPRVDNESDLSSLLARSPARALSTAGLTKNARQPSPLSKMHTRAPSAPVTQPQRRPSVSEAIDRLRKASLSPRGRDAQEPREHGSPHLSSAKSSLTAVPPSPESIANPDASHVRSFFMPDVSHLGDFVTGTLRFSGAIKNGVPIFVKHGKVHDQQEKPSTRNHAQVDGIQVSEDEEKIFVSMDMIREEIISLQEHYDKVQEYAAGLQQQVETLEDQLATRKPYAADSGAAWAHEQVVAQKNRLEVEVTTLQSRLEEASRKLSIAQIDNDSVSQERDRAIKKLQEACEDINKLTRKLSVKEKELENTHRQLEVTGQLRSENDTLRRDLLSLKNGREALELENASLRADNEALRREQQEVREELESLRSDNNSTRRGTTSLINENKSLRTANKALLEENEDLKENLDGVQHELDAVREQLERLQEDVQSISQERSTLREDNESLVRHNEKYFNENKVLRRENSGFERSIHDLHDENLKLKEEVDFLRQQLDHCRPLPKDDISTRFEDETDENMTSAFFIPDITMKTNESEAAEVTEGRDLTEPAPLTQDLPHVPETTGQRTHATTKNKHDISKHTQGSEKHQRSKSKSKNSSVIANTQSQKVAFSIPEKAKQTHRVHSNMANQGSKRRNIAGSSQQRSSNALETLDQFTTDINDDTTGPQSLDITTQDQSMPLSIDMQEEREERTHEEAASGVRGVTNVNTQKQHKRSASRTSQKLAVAAELTSESVNTNAAGKESCPALSSNARRVLDDLCGHNCQNCIVCSRITSHRGIVTSTDLNAGKKRVTVSRPVPVTDRELAGDDLTMRPSQSPGHALALVIKGLEDEAQHLQLELSRLQAQYNSSDKAYGRRERLSMAESIRTLLKRLEVKNDQIYSLYDVLEGQKAADQAMTEEEIELTVLNITGMTVRDVTSGSDQLTWEGIQEA